MTQVTQVPIQQLVFDDAVYPRLERDPLRDEGGGWVRRRRGGGRR